MKRNSYSNEFKEQALSKARERGQLPLKDIADTLNLSVGTLKSWLKLENKEHALIGTVTLPVNESAKNWSAAQRLQALHESHTLHAQAQEMASPVLPSPVPSLLLTSGNETCQDLRQSGLRQAVVPHNKLTEQEVKNVLDTINSDEFKDLPASQIVPRLADRGFYLASESTIGRIICCHSQNSLSLVRAQSPKTP